MPPIAQPPRQPVRELHGVGRLAAVTEVRVPLNAGCASAVQLRIALLPQRGQPDVLLSLLDERLSAETDAAVPPIQLLESQEYTYEWEGLSTVVQGVFTDPAEVFQPDTVDGLRGRLRPGLRTGTLPVVLLQAGAVLGEIELEVRSRKLNYISEYRWMLRDIAERMTELLMDRFAASETSFDQDDTRDAATLYQRFAFIRALIANNLFQLALGEITRRPHVDWVERHEFVRPGAPLKADSYGLRQLLRPGARIRWPGGPIDSLPVGLDRRQTEATHDTTPNRFVKFALERWRQVLADIDAGLASDDSDPAVRAGGAKSLRFWSNSTNCCIKTYFESLATLRGSRRKTRSFSGERVTGMCSAPMWSLSWRPAYPGPELSLASVLASVMSPLCMNTGRSFSSRARGGSSRTIV